MLPGPRARQHRWRAFLLYLDSPLLLDILGVSSTGYGNELLHMIHAAGANPMVFDDAIAEAESVVAARVAAARSVAPSL